MKDKATHPVIQSSVPDREFDGLGRVSVIAVFPDGRRMATSSSENMLRLWDLKNGTMMMEPEEHGSDLRDMALSRDGRLIASSDCRGYVIAWHGDTGRPLTQAFNAHAYNCWLDFSPDSATLATGSADCMVKFWNTKTWQLQGTSLNCGNGVTCIRYSPSGELLAIATNNNIQIWNPVGRARTASFGHGAPSVSLVWTPDGKCLLSGNHDGGIIREWDSLTWEQVGNIWEGGSDSRNNFAMNWNGTVVATLATSNHVHLWWLSDRRTIAIFRHSDTPSCVTFSMDGKHILVGGIDKISEWTVPEHAWPEHALQEQVTYQVYSHSISVHSSSHFWFQG